MVTLRRPFLLPLVILLVAACTAGPPASATPTESARPGTDVEEVRAVVARLPASDADAQAAGAAINELAFDVHRALAVADDNVVHSPASIAIALGMARAGARGNTATQMDGVMHDLASDEHAGGLSSLDQALASRSGTYEDAMGESHELTLTMANAWFGQRGYVFEPAFLEALAARFDAGMHLVDYVADPEAARMAINEWTREQTRDRIKDVLAPGVVDQSTRLALANAIYLKAPWQVPFFEELTETRAFTRPDGSTVDVPMMRSTIGIPCATGPGWEAMDLAYVGQDLSMLVVVPDDIVEFEAALDAEVLAAIDESLLQGNVDPDVSLPRFDFETKSDLVDVLSHLGMPDAFDLGTADFSGITRAERLAISAVVHHANITVDEKGTEAAAATVVAFAGSGPPPNKCVAAADRPFLFAIRDRPTGAILFMGRVVDPS